MTATRPEARAGDILLVDLAPTRGTEQSGTRPVLVISNEFMHEKTTRAIICPITGNMNPWPTKLPLPGGMKTKGMVLCDQVRTIDRKARSLRTIENVGPDFLQLVRAYVGRLIELDVD